MPVASLKCKHVQSEFRFTDELQNADVEHFDRYMKWLIGIPKEKVDKKQHRT